MTCARKSKHTQASPRRRLDDDDWQSSLFQDVAIDGQPPSPSARACMHGTCVGSLRRRRPSARCELAIPIGRNQSINSRLSPSGRPKTMLHNPAADLFTLLFLRSLAPLSNEVFFLSRNLCRYCRSRRLHPFVVLPSYPHHHREQLGCVCAHEFPLTRTKSPRSTQHTIHNRHFSCALSCSSLCEESSQCVLSATFSTSCTTAHACFGFFIIR